MVDEKPISPRARKIADYINVNCPLPDSTQRPPQVSKASLRPQHWQSSAYSLNASSTRGTNLPLNDAIIPQTPKRDQDKSEQSNHRESFIRDDSLFFGDDLGDLSQSVLEALDPYLQTAAGTPERPERTERVDGDSKSDDDYPMADPLNSWDDDELLALGNLSEEDLRFAPVDVDYEDDNDDAIQHDEDLDVPSRKRRNHVMTPPRPVDPLVTTRNPVPLSRQSTMDTLCTSASESISPEQRSFKRRYSDLETDATSESSGSFCSNSPKHPRTPSPSKSSAPRRKEIPVYAAYHNAALRYLALLPVALTIEASHLAEDCNIGWDVVTPLLEQLCQSPERLSSLSKAADFLYSQCSKRATNVAAHIRARYSRITPVLAKLDYEHTTLRQNPFGCLGNTGTEDAFPYGGCVQFVARLARVAGPRNSKALCITMSEPTHGPSMRFTRRFGSDRLIRLHVDSKQISQEDSMEFCRQPVVLGPYVFRAMFAKDGTIFLLRFDESLSDLGVELDGVLSRVAEHSGFKFTEESFLKWFNDPEINKRQTMGKWAARMALLFSVSVPGPLLKKSNIIFIPDIHGSDAQSSGGKVAPENVMTDGCGFANRAVFERVRATLNLEFLPGAIQFRCAGAKGLLIRHPHEFDKTREPVLWIRHSMNKIKYAAFETDEPLDPAMLTLDIIRTSNVTPARSSAETIINMGCNGVDSAVFIRIFQTALDNLIESLTKWDNADLPDLCATLETLSGRVSRNKAHLLGNEARARGISWTGRGGRDPDDIDAEEDSDEVVNTGGASDVWEDQILQLLRAGFHPHSCPNLARLLEVVVISEVRRALKKYRVELPLSATAFIAPDPHGILKEGEIYFRPSETTMRLKDASGNDFRDNVLRGPVLVTRHPCKLPTDVQKVKATSYDVLAEYRDVILFSTRGERSLASWLGGGDYDGDTVMVTWHLEIVTPFSNAPIEFSVAPEDPSQFFEKQPLTVERAIENDTFNDQFRNFLLAALDQRCSPGGYSILHDKAVYEKGYTHAFTLLMASMFCILLDSPKTGMRVLQGIYEDHKRQVSRIPPRWKDATSNKNDGPRSFYPNFIMDDLCTACSAMVNTHITVFKKRLEKDVRRNLDSALASLWQQRRLQAKKYEDAKPEITAVEAHVRAVHKEWKSVRDRFRLAQETRLRPLDGSPTSVKTPSRAANKERESVFIETAPLTINAEHHRICRLFAARPEGLSKNLIFLQEATLALDKASCAYCLAYEGPDPMLNHDQDTSAKFAFDVAMQELCSLKAQATGVKYEVSTEPFALRSKLFSL